MPKGLLGGVTFPSKTIWIHRSLGQIDRRWVLTHELIHLELDHDGPCNPKVECAVSAEAARRLIPIKRLADVATWATCVDEAARELQVPAHLLRLRLDRLHPSERTAIRDAMHRRDGNCQTHPAESCAC